MGLRVAFLAASALLGSIHAVVSEEPTEAVAGPVTNFAGYLEAVRDRTGGLDDGRTRPERPPPVRHPGLRRGAHGGEAEELVDGDEAPSPKGEAGSCATLNSLFPNQMYDLAAGSSCDAGAQDLWNVESALFRLITAQSNRIFQSERLWCFGSHSPDGVLRTEGQPYRFSDYAAFVVSLLDLVRQLQLVPPECAGRHAPLRELLLPGRDTSGMTTESVTSFAPEKTPALEWWEDEFLPTAAAAFSCGFGADDVHEDPDVLPNDIREAFPESVAIQQTWRLVKGYIRSPQKQRERRGFQQDFDVSLYVPFLPVPMSRVYLGIQTRDDGTTGASLRTGFPTYQGPNTWFLWHTIAARLAEIEDQCNPSDVDSLLDTAKNMVAYFGLTHPCPYCRHHFMMRVSRNDKRWMDIGTWNQVTRDGAPTSEAASYPLEYLFLGGPDGGSLGDKLDTIVDGRSLMLFFWKIHNTVSSSVDWGYDCKTTEYADEAAFACTPDGSVVRYTSDQETADARLLGRQWPTAGRFRYWLRGDGAFDGAREVMRDAHARLNRLDRQFGAGLRDEYWTDGADREARRDDVEAVLEAAAELDGAVLETGLLSTEYALDAAPSCRAFEESMDDFVPLDVPSPLVDGDFPFLPDGCIPGKGDKGYSPSSEDCELVLGSHCDELDVKCHGG